MFRYILILFIFLLKNKIMIPYLIAGAIGFVVAKLLEDDETPKYADGGSILLAPNGKTSNLTPEQYKLVRTPAFKEWFGDWENESSCQPYYYSKLEVKQNNMLLDENGEPQVFYHGSYNYGFTIVDVHGSSEQGLFWLSTSKEFARQFTGYKRFGYKDAQEYYDREGTGYLTGIYSFFVKTNKIFDVFNYNQVKEVNKELAELVGTKYTHTYEGKNGLGMLIKRKVEYESKDDKSYYYNLKSNDWKVVEIWENDMWIIGMLKELGYDCLTNDEGGVINIGFIGNPNQIKLADEMKDELGKINEKTNTTFDGNNPDIRFDEGGEITTYTEFYDNLQIEDGSKYIGQKFTDVFPFLKGSFSTPFRYKLKVKQYNDYLKRLSEDNYTTKSMKQADLNKIERNKGNINKVKYLSEFHCDSTGTIIDFRNNPDIRYAGGGLVVGENDDDNKFPTKDEAFELIQDSIESQGTNFIDEDGDGMFESEEEAQKYVDEIYDFFDYYYSLGMIPIYRGVKADEVDLDPYGIGESWSLYLDNAKQFASRLGSSKELKIISGYVPNNNVDWESAFRLYPLFSDFSDGDSEFELPIPSNNKIFNVQVSDYKNAQELEPYI
jgi:hypothetical protein